MEKIESKYGGCGRLYTRKEINAMNKAAFWSFIETKKKGKK